MKLLLYCTKAKPYLIDEQGKECEKNIRRYGIWDKNSLCLDTLNGKIVAECCFEVEEIIYNYLGNPLYDFNGMQLHTKTLKEDELKQFSKLNHYALRKYLLRTEDDYISPLEVGYAIHIKNLNIFDKPKYLDELWAFDKQGLPCKIERAPQNMMKCHVIKLLKTEDYILISIRPEWLCKILNGEKTIEVRKKVLKEMLECQK